MGWAMSYDYQKERPYVLSDEGQRMFLNIRDNVKRKIDDAGAVTMDRAFSGVTCGSSWTMMACVDRLVELGELVEVPNPVSSWAQSRIFVRPLRGD